VYLRQHGSSASVLFVCLNYACPSLHSVLGKSNKMDLLKYCCTFVWKAYSSTILLRNGNEKFIVTPILVHSTSDVTLVARAKNNVKWAELSTDPFHLLSNRVASGNSYKKWITSWQCFCLVLSSLTMYVSKLSLCSICSTIYHLLLRLDRSSSQLLKRPLHLKRLLHF